MSAANKDDDDESNLKDQDKSNIYSIGLPVFDTDSFQRIKRQKSKHDVKVPV